MVVDWTRTARRRRVRRYAPLVAVVVFTILVAACTDTPAPTSKGTRAVGGEVQEAGEAKPAPETEKGVVPDLIGVSVGDAKTAVSEAGFETGNVDTVGLFGTVADDWLVCTQKPEAGASPGRGTKVHLTADREC